jgi:hypothetical protein
MACLDGLQNDLDFDGIGDYCEKWMGPAFAPELFYSSTDDIRGEPRWAMRIVSAGEARLEVIYLLSYYMDLGSQALICQTSTPIYPHPCAGHYGDSEAILLEVQYVSATQHWVLRRARLSQHGDLITIGQGPKGYPTLQYPERSGGYPRIYVSQGKHANYPSDATCDSGGTLGVDNCSSNTYARVAVAANGDIGSSSQHLIDCVASTNPLYAGRAPECYWTGLRFNGWQDGAQPSADPYSDLLLPNGY